MFAALLHEDDARRATETVEAVQAHGLQCALTGGLAIAAQLRAHGRPIERRHLNDIDLVVPGFGAIPESVAVSFLLHHVHPDATEGKTLLQLIDETTAVRVDLFRAFGNTLAQLEEATREANRLLEAHPELLVIEEYSTAVTPCERCRAQGPFRSGAADKIVQTLGYW